MQQPYGKVELFKSQLATQFALNFSKDSVLLNLLYKMTINLNFQKSY